MIYFLILSGTGSLLLLIAASPSSLNSPTFSVPIRLDSFSRRYKPTSSKIQASSKLPFVTSNNISFTFFNQVPSLLKSSDFLASFIALMALSSIFVKDLAYSMSSYSFGRTQNVGDLESSEKKIRCFIGDRESLKKTYSFVTSSLMP